MEQVKEYSFIFNAREFRVVITREGGDYGFAVHDESGEVVSQDTGFESEKRASDKANYSVSVPTYL